MTERVRYRNVSENLLESTKTFTHPTNGAEYKIQINTAEPKWEIIEVGCDMVAASGRKTRMAYTFIDIKKALTQLGIILPVEKRKPRTVR